MGYSCKDFPRQEDVLLSTLKKIWCEGWLDEFSEEHFLIRAIYGYPSDFRTRKQIKDSSPNLYNDCDESPDNFLINFSCQLNRMIRICSEDSIENFVKNQLSAGKSNYCEDQFFQAFHEMQVFNFFTSFGEYNVEYEPKIGGESGEKNPEFRITNKFQIPGPTSEKNIVEIQNYMFDIEVKSIVGNLDASVDEKNSFIVPTMVIDYKKRKELESFCNERGFQLELPDIVHLCEFINNATEKFQYPLFDNHFNILFLNWTHREIPRINYIEPLSLLFNSQNGLLRHKDIGTKRWINEEVYKKISAIFIYTYPIQSLVFGDLRWVFANKSYAVLLNSSLNDDQKLKLTYLLKYYNLGELDPKLLFSVINNPHSKSDIESMKHLEEIQEYIESIQYR